MTQEDKQLLLKDLVARLPYGVKCTTKSSWNGIYTIEGYKDDKFFLDCPVYDEGDDEWMIESVVPYLRPMSSMTEEEKKEFYKVVCDSMNIDNISPSAYVADWQYSKHFDVHGLIPKGLANEAPEGMYKKEE